MEGVSARLLGSLVALSAVGIEALSTVGVTALSTDMPSRRALGSFSSLRLG